MSSISLEQLRVAAPCPAAWSEMAGDERVRFCGQCRKNVYNLSGMRRDEAEALVAEKEGDLCVRFFQRADGTVLTADCPVGLRQRMRRLAGRMVATVAAAVLLIAESSGAFGPRNGGYEARFLAPLDRIVNRLSPPPPIVTGGFVWTPPPQQNPAMLGKVQFAEPCPDSSD